MKILLQFLLFFSLVLTSTQGWGAPPVNATYGGELEFRHPIFSVESLVSGNPVYPLIFLSAVGLGAGLYSHFTALPMILDLGYVGTALLLQTGIKSFMIRRWVKEILRTCDGCGAEERRVHSYGRENYVGVRIVYPDGWWMEIGIDPQVIEVKHLPTSNGSTKLNEARLQRDLFDTGAKVGLRPSYEVAGQGNTHINIGLLTFRDDARFLRNFIVDFHNHPELARGVWHYDTLNAPTPMESEEGRAQFEALIAQFDQLPEGKQTVDALIALLTENLFAKRFTALSLSRARNGNLENLRRLELRAMHSVGDAAEYSFFVDLIDKRLQWVSDQSGLIAFNNEAPTDNPTEKVARYRGYIEECGGSWTKAASYLREPLATPARCGTFLAP